jgi:Cdc6-like AAA superfamily ATPase
MEFLEALLKAKTGGALCLCGAAGTGKTLVVTACLHRIQKDYHGLDVVVVNAQTCVPLASRLADKLGVKYEEGDDNDARTKLFATLVPRMPKTGDARAAITTIICVDEIDEAPNDLARQLLEGASAPNSQYVLIGIANTRKAQEGAASVAFEPYKADKLAEILKARTYGLFTTAALKLITLQAATTGDCRRAIDTAYAALRVAAQDARGLDQRFNPEQPIVNNAHVLEVKKSHGAGIMQRREALKSFDPHVRLLLVAAATGFSDLSRTYSVKQIYEQYTTLCSILGTSNPPLSDDTLHDALHWLSDYQFVTPGTSFASSHGFCTGRRRLTPRARLVFCTAVTSFGRLGNRGADSYRFAFTAEELLPHVEPVLARHLQEAIARKQTERS